MRAGSPTCPPARSVAEAVAPDGTGEEPALIELVSIIARLRRECAWKAAQTHRSLTRYLLEESHEAIEAIETGDAESIRDELGDVLLQVYLHAAIAAEAGQFDIEDVAAGLRDKMIRRNPHVFGSESETEPERINERWQQIKATEPGRADREGLDAGIPKGLPALLRALKVLERLDRAGDEAPEVVPTDDFGSRLLVLVNEARRAGVDPEQALGETVRELARRVR